MVKKMFVGLLVALMALGGVAHASATNYVVQPGDTLSRIAAWNGMSVSRLLALNPQVTNASMIYVGETLNLAATQQWEKTADAIIAQGQSYWGTPYVYGATRFQDKNFDCSSFVQFLYNQQGISLGWNTVEQAAQGQWVPFDQLRKGDIMFFEDDAFPNQVGLNKAQHVGIYMGDGLILHTYQAGIGVTISAIRNDAREGQYWYTHYLFAKRVI